MSGYQQLEHAQQHEIDALVHRALDGARVDEKKLRAWCDQIYVPRGRGVDAARIDVEVPLHDERPEGDAAAWLDTIERSVSLDEGVAILADGRTAKEIARRREVLTAELVADGANADLLRMQRLDEFREAARRRDQLAREARERPIRAMRERWQRLPGVVRAFYRLAEAEKAGHVRDLFLTIAQAIRDAERNAGEPPTGIAW
jgi:hypothetical protein